MKTWKILLVIFVAVFAMTACGDDDDNDDNDGDADDDLNDDADDDIDDDADDDMDDDLNDDVDDDVDDDADDDFDPTDYVNPFMGTMADHGQLAPDVNVPFGMIKISPDTLIRSHAGYEYAMANTIGISHVRVGGVGARGAGGNIRILPGIGDRSAFGLWMGKEDEIAEPGYYAVDLGVEQQIFAELTATDKVGMHRYTFKADGPRYLIANFNDPFTEPLGSQWEVNETNDEIYGYVSAQNVSGKGKYTLYFSMLFNKPFTTMTTWPCVRGGTSARFDFDLGREDQLLVKTGLSSVSVEEARMDMDIEVPDWDFDLVREQTRNAWRDMLSVVSIQGDDEEMLTVFYTMLFRATQNPVNVTTHSGKYFGTDGQVHQAEGYRRHHCWSIWDTYRNKFALHNLLYPARAGEIMQSLVAYYLEGKAVESTEFEPYPNTRTEHAASLLLDAYRKGVTGFDYEPAFEVIKNEALVGGSPDRELEGSFDRWVIAHLAKILGDDETYDEYLAESNLYRDVWLEHFKEMGADADIVGARGLYQGTLWQYRWAVVHDIEGMMELDGGRDIFLAKLHQFFDEELYNQGNEPDIHVPFLFNYAGAPWRTQDVVRAILSEHFTQWYGGHEKWPIPSIRRIYRPNPWGYIMNMDDDAGTMSAWYVFGAIGLYPVTIGHPVYALMPPLFERVDVHLENGATYTAIAEGASAENRYIQSATHNGEPLNRAWLHHDEVVAGAEVIFEMGSEPNEAWGAAPENAPPPAFE